MDELDKNPIEGLLAYPVEDEAKQVQYDLWEGTIYPELLVRLS